MSFYEESSIIITPNAYKAGTLYAVVPTSGAADMDATRATAATRVDESGLVNYAEVLGSNLAICGDFECASPLTGWTDNAPIGEISIDSGRLKVLNLTERGRSYRTYTGLTPGNTYKAFVGNTGGIGGFAHITSGASHNNIPLNVPYYFVAGAATAAFQCGVLSTAVGMLTYFDNISLKQVDRDNVPRIDYTGGGCPHILSEPQRTNLFDYSEEISQYSKTQATVINNTTTSPDGTVNASKVTKNGVSANDRVYVNNLVISNTTDYSLSAFIKNDDIVNGGVSTIGARTTGGTFFRQGYEWNGSVLSVTTSNQSGTRTNVLLEDYGNGWWKIGFSFTSDGTEADLEFDIDRVNGTDTTSIFLWGAQLEEGSYATSYIPTSGAMVTRNQDQFTRDGISSLINSTEGVLFMEASTFENGADCRITLSDGTITNRVSIEWDILANTIKGFVGSDGNLVSPASYNQTDSNKIALKYKENDCALWINGVEVDTDFSVSALSGVNQLEFSNPGGAVPFEGKIKQLQVYPTALSDSELTTLTTP